jgi:hypothetical protein
VDDPSSEEEQGRSLAKAAADAGVECFLWSTLPSSYEISGGKFQTRLYEGKPIDVARNSLYWDF